MAFDFDEAIDRRRSDSVKWHHFAEDILPMWVADTDFRSPPCITDALQARVAHGVFGYGKHPDGLAEAFIAWCQHRYNWQVKPEWLVFLPGIVSGLNLCVRAFTSKREVCLAPTPIYPPFRHAARLAGRQQVLVPLHDDARQPGLDLDAAAPQLTGREKLLLLCNPQNPGGAVYRREALDAQLAFARRHNLVVCSDEIHCDLLLEPGLTHLPFAALSDDAARRSIILMSPSKTINIAGLGASVAVIPNPTLRRQFIQARSGLVPQPDILATVAAEAAWRNGEPWLNAQLAYLRRNRDRLCQAINALPGLRVIPPEATYLAWIDASGLNADDPARVFLDAGIGASSGAEFGNSQYVRLNFGCTAATLELAIDRLTHALG